MSEPTKPTSCVAEEDVLDPGALVDDYSKCSLCGFSLKEGSSEYHLKIHQQSKNCSKARTVAQKKGAQLAFKSFRKLPNAGLQLGKAPRRQSFWNPTVHTHQKQN